MYDQAVLSQDFERPWKTKQAHPPRYSNLCMRDSRHVTWQFFRDQCCYCGGVSLHFFWGTLFCPPRRQELRGIGDIAGFVIRDQGYMDMHGKVSSCHWPHALPLSCISNSPHTVAGFCGRCWHYLRCFFLSSLNWDSILSLHIPMPTWHRTLRTGKFVSCSKWAYDQKHDF